MELKEKSDNNKKVKLDKARLRVAEIKGFYIHLIVFFVINTAILVIKIIGNAHYGETFMGPVWHFSTYGTWLFWGIGLALHGVVTFSKNPFIGKRWEKRQIEKFIEEEKREAENFTDY